MADSLDIVVRVNEVLTLHMRPEYVLVTVSLEFADGVTVESPEEPIEILDRRIKQVFPEVEKVFVEAESIIHRPASLDELAVEIHTPSGLDGSAEEDKDKN